MPMALQMQRRSLNNMCDPMYLAYRCIDVHKHMPCQIRQLPHTMKITSSLQRQAQPPALAIQRHSCTVQACNMGTPAHGQGCTCRAAYSTSIISGLPCARTALCTDCTVQLYSCQLPLHATNPQPVCLPELLQAVSHLGLQLQHGLVLMQASGLCLPLKVRQQLDVSNDRLQQHQVCRCVIWLRALHS